MTTITTSTAMTPPTSSAVRLMVVSLIGIIIVALNDGYRLAFLLGAGFAATGAIVAFKFIPRTVRPVRPADAPSGAGAALPRLRNQFRAATPSR